MKNLFVFDCEATSLHGSTFAVGAIVADGKGIEIDRFELLSNEGKEKACIWVQENVIPSLSDMPICETDRELRDRFFEFYMKHKGSCDIYSDCNFPVETNFLFAVVTDDIEKRQWAMPYPLKDISTIIDIDIDRCAMYEGKTRLKLRRHNPVDDSIASLYCLLHY